MPPGLHLGALYWYLFMPLERYLVTGNNLTDFRAVWAYAKELKPSSRAFLKSALRLITADYEQLLKAGASPKNITA